jgi:hypothetical protein
MPHMPPAFTLPPSLPEINIIEEIPQALILPHPSTQAAPIAEPIAAPIAQARPMQIRRQAKPAIKSSVKHGKMFGL